MKNYKEFLDLLIEENTDEEIIKTNYDFLINPKNIESCSGCHYNRGLSDWQRRKPCGQYICWVEIHCERKEKE